MPVRCARIPLINDARVAKLADAPDLGSGGAILRGSSPLPGAALWPAAMHWVDKLMLLQRGRPCIILNGANELIRRAERSQSGEHGYSGPHIGNSVCIASPGQAVSG